MKYPSVALFYLGVLVKTGLALADLGAKAGEIENDDNPHASAVTSKNGLYDKGLRSKMESNAGYSSHVAPFAETLTRDGVRGPSEGHFPKEGVLTEDLEGILEERRPVHEGSFSDGHEENVEERQAATWKTFYPVGKDVTYMRPFSDEGTGYSDRQTAPIVGIVCSGRYCDNKRLIVVRDGYSKPVTVGNYWTHWFTDGGTNHAYCPPDKIVNELQCRGRYCDDIRLQCGTLTPDYRVNASDLRYVGPFSEEDGERRCPGGYYLWGMQCSGDYCDNIKLFCAKVEYQGVTPPTKNYVTDGTRYAPIYYFDGSSSSYCYPDWPSTENDNVCKTSFATVTPSFVQFDICGTEEVYTYWLWYGKQQQCAAGGKGEHGDDWEHVSVFVRDGVVQKVMYYQHAGRYTRRSGKFDSSGDRPHVYVGKIGHGSYHHRCDGNGVIWSADYCQGGCGYWDDMRNPGPKIQDNYKLYDLRKGETVDGITRPNRDICASWCEGSGSRLLTTSGCWQNDP